MFRAFLWSNSNICLVNTEIHYNFHLKYCTICLCKICFDWWHTFVVSNLIGDHIFLWSEPRNSIACHQTLVQGLGTRLVSHHHAMRLSINPQKLQNSSTLNDLQYEVYIYIYVLHNRARTNFTFGYPDIQILLTNKYLLMLLFYNNYLTTNFRASQMDWDQVATRRVSVKA